MKKALYIMSALILLSVSVQAREAMHGSAAAEFKVKATVDSFTGKAVSEPLELQPGDDSISVTFAIAKMETGKKKRDKEMMHMFHAEEFPLITGTTPAVRVLDLKPGENAELPVSVTIHGVTKQVVGMATAIVPTEDGLSFDLEFPLSLKEFGLKPPSVMGIIRVNDQVQVVSHVTLGKGAPAKE